MDIPARNVLADQLIYQVQSVRTDWSHFCGQRLFVLWGTSYHPIHHTVIQEAPSVLFFHSWPKAALENSFHQPLGHLDIFAFPNVGMIWQVLS